MKTRQEFMEWLEEAEKTIIQNSWQDRKVHPYGFAMPVSKIISDCKDFDRCTDGSKEYLMSLANGFKEILDAWVEHDLLPKIKVRIIKSGKIVEIAESDFDMFDGLVERI